MITAGRDDDGIKILNSVQLQTLSNKLGPYPVTFNVV